MTVARGLLDVRDAMLKLTRLNRHTVVVNPDHIYLAEALPDTTLRLLNGDTIIVRESLDELIERVVEYRRTVGDFAGRIGCHDAAAIAAVTVERQRRDAASDDEQERE